MAADDQRPEPRPCSPCRGTGQVISNLGGSPSTLACPWCAGTGTFIPEHDAQAAHREAQVDK
jgi:DnaJ-class molecular chaperone